MWQRIHPVRIYSLDTHDALLLAAGVFFFGGADFFSRSDFFSDTVRDVSGEHREPPWA